MVKQKSSKAASSDATMGYEAQLRQMADALRGSMDAAKYKPIVLGMIFRDPYQYRAQSLFRVTTHIGSLVHEALARIEGNNANPPLNVSAWGGKLLRRHRLHDDDLCPSCTCP